MLPCSRFTAKFLRWSIPCSGTSGGLTAGLLTVSLWFHWERKTVTHTKCSAYTLLAAGVAAGLTVIGALASSPADASLTSVSALASAEIVADNDRLAPLDDQGRRLYIVRLHEPSLAAYEGGIAGLAATSPRAIGTARLDVDAPASRAYLDYLSSRQAGLLDAVSGQVGRRVEPTFSYLNVLNAMAVSLTPDEARRVEGIDGVRSVEADRIRELETDVGPELIGAPAIWEGETLAGLDTRGEGVTVGIIDTGINSQHPSFAATDMDGYTHTNPYGSGNYVGWCVDNPAFCNDKLIGAWTFHPNGGSPEDTHGHGSHVGGTAAGNRHFAAFQIGGETFNIELSGVAPRANVIAYKVCDPGCPGSSSIAAVNQGIADGVDVLNFSISGTDNPWLDAVDQAFLDAYAANVFVAASAGNDGPGASTVAKTGPWNAAVAASTHARVFANAVHLDGGPQDLAGTQGTGPEMTADYVGTLRWAGEVDPANAEGCDAFPPGSFDGEAALIARGGCQFVNKINNAVAAGAEFVVAYNNAGGPPISMGGLEDTTVPSLMVDNVAGQALIDALAGGTAQVEIDVAVNMFEIEAYADVMGSFSSRGPSQFELMAPTLSAPGVGILAAGPNIAGNAEQWYLSQGTSMSSPHAAGAAALVRGLYPNLSPAEIRSMMSLSADPDVLIKEDGITPADPFDQGSGRLDLEAAGRLMLVMDETVANFEAADPLLDGDPRTLNVPHLLDYSCQGSCSWTRTFTSIADEPVSYQASANAPAGMSVSVDPSSFTIAPGASQTLEITADVDLDVLPAGEWAFADLVLEPVDGSSVTGELLNENFSDGEFPPPGWSRYELGASSPVWARTESQSHSGPASAWANYNSSDNLDNWLVTPALDLSAGTYELSFFERVSFMSWYVYSGVWASTDSCDPEDGDFVELYEILDEANFEWRETTIDLSAFVAESAVCLAFRYSGEDAHTWYIDDVIVREGPAESGVAAARMPIVVIPLFDVAEIELSAEALSMSLSPGDAASQNLEIINNGNSELTWSIQQAPRSFSLELSDAPAATRAGTAGIANPFELVLDDGTGNNAVGVGGAQFVWFNRFTPDVIDFPITLEQIEIMFGYPGSTGGINVGELVDIYLYEDADGDPANGADHRVSLHDQEVQSVSGTTWSTYGLAEPVTFEGPGDILIAVVNRTAGTAPSTFPAVIDQTSPSQGRSWIGFNAVPSDPPDFTEFPTLGVIDGLGIAGNYLLRGYGTTDGACYNPEDVPWLSVDPTSGTTAANSSTSVEVSYDAAGLSAGTYEAVLCINSNDPDNSVIGVLVTMTVGEPAEIEVTPAELVATVSTDSTIELPLDIANQGTGELSWSIDTAQVPSGAVTYGVQQPGLAQAVFSPQGVDRASGQSLEAVARPFPPAAVLGGPVTEFDEGFEDITTLPGAGWSLQNLSDPLGTSDWFQGNSAVFPSHQGPADAYIAANYGSTSGAGTISNWLITPEVVLRNGTELRFWTRSVASDWEDRLEVRMSTSGDSTDVGSSATSVGDFDTLMLSINPDLEPGGYPTTWTEIVVEVEGLPEATSGRFALRYYVTDGGPSGTHSDYIGLDTLSVSQPEEGCASPETIGWLSVSPDSGTTAAGAVSTVDVALDADGLGEGTYEALLCVSSNDPASPLVEVPVAMTVVDQDPSELDVQPLELAFGGVDVGDAATQSFSVGNVADAGAMSLQIGTLGLGGDAGFAITGGDCTVGSQLEPGESCLVEVTFTPGSAGSYDATVAVATTDGQSASVTLSGEGVQDPAVLDVDPGELTFGEVILGDAATLGFTVSNAAAPGAMSLEISALDPAGDPEFVITGGDCVVGSELEPGESCAVEITFTPSDFDTFSGSTAVATTDGQSATVMLSGEGVDLPDGIFQDRFEALD